MEGKHDLAAIAVLSATAIGNVHAAVAVENDARAIESATIGLSEAVNTAERQTGGKASRAEFEKDKGGWAFDVEVVIGKKVMDIKADLMTGTVLAAMEDKADRDSKRDANDGSASSSTA